MAFAGGPFNHFVLQSLRRARPAAARRARRARPGHDRVGHALQARAWPCGRASPPTGGRAAPGRPGRRRRRRPPTVVPVADRPARERPRRPRWSPSPSPTAATTGLEPVRTAIVADLPDGVRTAATCEDARDRPPRRRRGPHRAGGRGEGHDIQPVSAPPPAPSRPRLVDPELAARVPGLRRVAGVALAVGRAERGGRRGAGRRPGPRRRPLAAAPRAAERRRARHRPGRAGHRGPGRAARCRRPLGPRRGRPRRGRRCAASCSRHALALGPGWLAGERPGELSLTATRGLRSLHTYYARYLPQAAAAAVIPVILLAWVATQDWLSFVVVIALVIAVPVTMIYFGREATRRSERQWRRLGSLAGRFLQLVEGLPTLRAFGREAARAPRGGGGHRRRARRPPCAPCASPSSPLSPWT